MRKPALSEPERADGSATIQGYRMRCPVPHVRANQSSWNIPTLRYYVSGVKPSENKQDRYQHQPTPPVIP